MKDKWKYQKLNQKELMGKYGTWDDARVDRADGQ